MNPKIIGRSIQKLRAGFGLSRATLAEYAGCSQQSVRLIELGRANPELKTLNNLASALGTTVEALAAGGARAKNTNKGD